MASNGVQGQYPYRDKTKSIEDRLSDLISRMTLAEKAGQLFHHMIVIGHQGSLSPPLPAFGLEGTEDLIQQKLMSHFNLIGPIEDAKVAAQWYNRLQQYVLDHTRLGIPVTLSTDPRNHFTDNVGTSFNAGVMSRWPETLGFAALRNTTLVERFADIARQEYIAIGLRAALHPQIDLATEYRWARISATFGEDAELSGYMGQAYIRGFQGACGEGFGPESVSTMTKHFPGGGPQMNGEDAHFVYGQEQVYPGENFEYHLRPFTKAIEAGTRQIMPYYGMPIGTEYEEVGFGLSRGIITDLLRERLGFNGIVCTDWGLLTDTNILGQDMPARAWGCNDLSELEKAKKILDAGCDQFGGESRPGLVVELVEKGLIPESRLDLSLERLMREKFTLGLFDDPFVDVEAAASIVGNLKFVEEGEAVQRKSYTLLTNKNNILPMKEEYLKSKKFYLEGFSSSAAASRHIQSVNSASDADIAIMRLRCPYEPRPGGFEAGFHAGSLEYSPTEKARQAAIYDIVPISIVDVYLDRPAVIPEIADCATALLTSYGSSDDALLDVIFGVAGVQPLGKLPFDLPSSMEAVRNSREDVPFDTKNPSFRFGHGLRYAA